MSPSIIRTIKLQRPTVTGADKKYFVTDNFIISTSVSVFAMLKKILLILYIARSIVTQNMEPFIVGGKPVAIKHFSHSSFVTVDINHKSFVCGASILNQNIILSAAHCFEEFNRQSKISVRAGNAHKLRGSLRHAAKLAIHTGYNPQTIENDIALVYLKKPFVFNSYIKRVIIMKHPPRSRVGYVAGWGLTDENRKIDSDWLQIAEQRLWSREECTRVLHNIPLGILCGGVKHSREYASEGDSGSALVINGSVQIGLVSFKKPEISRSVVVYTDVAYFYNWITTTARRLYCP